MLRTGDEPAHARSPLRMRFWLAIWGLLWTAGGTIGFAVSGHPGFAIACGVLAVITMADLGVLVHHVHQGPHWQPGREIPPYHPVEEPGDADERGRTGRGRPRS
jgi:Family of unknown function (DUF6343)